MTSFALCYIQGKPFLYFSVSKRLVPLNFCLKTNFQTIVWPRPLFHFPYCDLWLASVVGWYTTHPQRGSNACLCTLASFVHATGLNSVEGWCGAVELPSCSCSYGMSPSTLCVICAFLSHLVDGSFSSCQIPGPSCIFFLFLLMGQHHVKRDSAAVSFFLVLLLFIWVTGLKVTDWIFSI